MAEIWLNGANVAQQTYSNRHPEKGDIIEVQVSGQCRDYVVEKKLVHYDRQGAMTERLYVTPA